MGVTLISSKMFFQHSGNTKEAKGDQDNKISEARRERNRRRNIQRRKKRKEQKDFYNSDSSSSGDGSVDNKQSKCTKQNKKSESNTKGGGKATTGALTAKEQEQYVAIDCEMVGCGLYGSQSMLARVTIVDWNSQILFDTYVKPTNEVTDYRTHVSGITSYHLSGPNAIELDICRHIVLNIIKNKILIGHALKNV